MPFEFDAKKYAKASAHQKEWGAKLISEFALAGHERILDLGCGDGALTAQLADLVPDGWVVGIDASRAMIDAAGARARANLNFRLMDINALDFRDEFDVALVDRRSIEGQHVVSYRHTAFDRWDLSILRRHQDFSPRGFTLFSATKFDPG